MNHLMIKKTKNPRRPVIPYVRRFHDHKNDFRRQPKHKKQNGEE